MYKKHAFRLAAGLLLLPLAALAAPAGEPVGPLRTALEQLPAYCSGYLPPLQPAARERLQGFYARQDFAPVWRSYRQIDGLLRQLEQLADDGLAPTSYHLERIRQLTHSASAAPQHRICSDLLATTPTSAPCTTWPTAACRASRSNRCGAALTGRSRTIARPRWNSPAAG